MDALNRITRETISDPAPTEIATTAYSRDGNGNVLSIAETGSAGTRTQTRHYDSFDRLDREQESNADSAIRGKALSYGYDAVGNRQRVTDVSGTPADITTWTYNALNQNTGVSVTGQGSTAIAYFPSGRRLSFCWKPIQSWLARVCVDS